MTTKTAILTVKQLLHVSDNEVSGTQSWHGKYSADSLTERTTSGSSRQITALIVIWFTSSFVVKPVFPKAAITWHPIFSTLENQNHTFLDISVINCIYWFIHWTKKQLLTYSLSHTTCSDRLSTWVWYRPHEGDFCDTEVQEIGGSRTETLN